MPTPPPGRFASPPPKPAPLWEAAAVADPDDSRAVERARITAAAQLVDKLRQAGQRPGRVGYYIIPGDRVAGAIGTARAAQDTVKAFDAFRGEHPDAALVLVTAAPVGDGQRASRRRNRRWQ